MEASVADAMTGHVDGLSPSEADAHFPLTRQRVIDLWPNFGCPDKSSSECWKPCTWNQDIQRCELDCIGMLTKEKCHIHSDCAWIAAKDSGGKYKIDTCQQRCGSILKKSVCTMEPDCQWRAIGKDVDKCVPLHFDYVPFLTPTFKGDLKTRFLSCIKPAKVDQHVGEGQQQNQFNLTAEQEFTNSINYICKKNRTVQCIKASLEPTEYRELLYDALRDDKCQATTILGRTPEETNYNAFKMITEDARKHHCIFTTCMERERARFLAKLKGYEARISSLRSKMTANQYEAAREFLGAVKKSADCGLVQDTGKLKQTPSDALDSTRECRQMIQRCERFSDKIDEIIRSKFIYKHMLSLLDGCGPMDEQECIHDKGCHFEYGRCKPILKTAVKDLDFLKLRPKGLRYSVADAFIWKSLPVREAQSWNAANAF
eukprot:GEMP01045881.1.p1 GENE.GEMP01045881.1~~GEMP01045881.1.p1  ORF type:complete len:430 (+),score=52.29 GEMP01045881.1:147-1436(+)